LLKEISKYSAGEFVFPGIKNVNGHYGGTSGSSDGWATQDIAKKAAVERWKKRSIDR